MLDEARKEVHPSCAESCKHPYFCACPVRAHMCCAAPIPCAAPMPCVLEVFLRTGEDSHMHVSGAAELEMSTSAWGTWGHQVWGAWRARALQWHVLTGFVSQDAERGDAGPPRKLCPTHVVLHIGPYHARHVFLPLISYPLHTHLVGPQHPHHARQH